MDPVWRSRQEDLTAPGAPELGLPAVIARLLSARGLSDAGHFERLLYPKLAELRDPSVLRDMDVAVARLEQAYRRGEKICIYADFDLDGTSGLALLWTGLRDLGFKDVLRYQPKRLSEGYGFHAGAVEDLHRQGVSLIVTVDVGITAIAAAEKARELGVDVIITDHHLPAAQLPPAVAVVNPNREGGGSELGYLCGAGVAFYLFRALSKRFHEATDLPKPNVNLKSLLDFFTIATLTDMVPLVEDNRVLVKHGLVVLAETERAGLKALLEELGLRGRALTSQDVAVRFAPKLNALSRMEAGVLPIDIFLCDDPAKARDLITHVMANNSTRVQLQSEAETAAVGLLRDWPHDEFVFVASENFHRGVVGLIATKLAQTFNRPAFVGSLDPQEGTIVGSARLPNGAEACLVEALGSAERILNRFGGHSAAAGFELHGHRADEFVAALAAHFRALKEKPRPLEIVYDLDLGLADVNASLMKWYDFAGPFGAGFPVPVFRFADVRVLRRRDLKGGHVKLTVAGESGETFEALLFSPSERQLKLLEGGGGRFDFLGELQWNYYAGNRSIQILVKDLKVRTWQ